MNYLKVIFLKKAILTKMRTLALSAMALTVFLCGSCELLEELDPDEFEPNNSISEAHQIEQGETYDAQITENDVDFFSFTTAHGSTTFDEVEISVFNAGPNLMIGAVVYDSDGEQYSKNDVTTEGAKLTYTLSGLEGGATYYIRFSGTWDSHNWDVGGAGDYWSEGAYSFSIMNLDVNDEFAGNHTINDAQPITKDQTYNAVLVSKWEADFFAFTPTTENMQLQVTNVGSDLIIGIALYTPTGELLGNFGAKTPGAGYTLNLNNMNTEATYYIRFSGTWGSAWEVGGAGDFYNKGPYTVVLVDN